MNRKSFLLGSLVGLVCGVALSAALHWGVTTKGDLQPVETRTPLRVVPPEQLQRPHGIPPEANRREFNGGSYYIIPLVKTS
jgi:hypothetical protein